jgi:hypothetical protein
MQSFMTKQRFRLIGAILLLGVSVLVFFLTRPTQLVERDVSTETTLPDEPANSPYLANHRNILTTWFRGGTPAGVGDRGTSNVDSAWYKDWRVHLGGTDTGQLALTRPGLDNLYYFALPCPDYNEQGIIPAHIDQARAAGLSLPATIDKNHSAFKNLWIQVRYGSKTVYAQWEDVGPLGPNVKNDCAYVFGSSRPLQEKTKTIDSALDLSPSAYSYLQSNLDTGVIKTSWAFVSAEAVPDGPWKANVTTAGPDW